MTHYLILESRDPYDSADWGNIQEMVINLKRNGNNVTLFLLQNGVLPARKSTSFTKYFADLKKLEINILADFFSLQERGIQEISPSVEKSNIDQLIHMLFMPDTKTVWH
ncbi:hypothetical protein [Mastigocoleus testarum]|uniref:Sulfur reduction protein DsrE n=1 Tax=Mastigocoleus testarum BC008 TaxID=371196 RepID=A0A0V7ZSL2_9CYAN|nr:hypothetical protein [Mastigocoleus testarum]KST67454.1 hypothetical protein BC008_30105 [Mastigocoleus testarum BC008]